VESLSFDSGVIVVKLDRYLFRGLSDQEIHLGISRAVINIDDITNPQCCTSLPHRDLSARARMVLRSGMPWYVHVVVVSYEHMFDTILVFPRFSQTSSRDP